MRKLNKLWEKVNLKFATFLTTKNITIFVLLISIILLLPVFRVAFYIHPSADDYDYGVYTIGALDKGIGNLIIGVGKTVHKFYTTWQGTYAASALFALNPSVWGDNCYFLTTFIIAFSISFACFYLFKQIKEILGIDKMSFYLIYLLFITLVLETLPDATQGLYWWNGACYYMIFFSFELVLIALLLKRYFLNKATKQNYILSCIIVVLIGGGNFITASQQIIILTLFNIYLLFKKKDKTALTLLALSIISFLISALAPGNAERAALVQGMSAPKAIIKSFYYAGIKAKIWIAPLNVVIISLIILILSKSYKNIKFKFNHPFILIAIITCVFAAEFTPTLYATGDLGAGRLWNIMYISYLIFIIIVAYYFIGNFREKILAERILTKNYNKGIDNILKKNCIIITIFITAFLSYTIYKNKTCYTTYNTFYILKNGEAKTYDKEFKQRLKVLKNKKIKRVEFKPYTYYPYPIIFTDLEEDQTNWKNLSMAKAYGKEYIKIVKEESK